MIGRPRTARTVAVNSKPYHYPESSIRSSAQGVGRTGALAAHSPSLRLLRGYLELLSRDALGDAPEVLGSRQLTSTIWSRWRSVRRVTLQRSRRGGGVSAAYLQAIKKYIVDNLIRELSLGSVARHRITPRYVQKLFEREGTSFTEFMRDARLESAHRMLSNPRFERMKIAEIAYGAGFNDLSHFNRHFRVRYGCAPSDVRHARQADSVLP
jgi:AraC-like DNA-binding protein